jgi:hypothetical protein
MNDCTGISLSGVVIQISWSKCPTLDGVLRIASDARDLHRQLQGNGLVSGGCASRCWILVLADGCNLRIDCLDRSTGVALKAHFAGITLECAVYQSCNLTVDITSGLRIGESLVGSRLLETFDIRDCPFPSCCCLRCMLAK